MKKKVLLIFLSFVLVTSMLTGCKSSDNKVVWTIGLGKKQLFKIEDETCSMGQGKLILANYENTYTNTYGSGIWGTGDKKRGLYQRLKNQTLTQLAQTTSMELLAKKEKVKLSTLENDAVKKAAKEYWATLSKKEIEYFNIKEEDVQDLYERYAIADKLYTKLTGGVNEEVSDDDARIVTMRQIFVASQEKEKQVEKELESGKDFKSVANYYNEAGKIEISFGRNDMETGVIEAAFALEPGQISPAVQTKNGFYFLQCISKLDRKKTDENKNVIVEQRAKEAFDDVYHSFANSLTTEYNKEGWEDLQMGAEEGIKTDQFFVIYESNIGDWSE